MATRQYIGARYTPKFSGTYDNTQAYEALEVVDNGSGTTYIARQPVPPNTPLTNTTYWLVYGSSSGAILDLQTRMGNAEDDIDDIESDVSDIKTNINTINGSIAAMGGEISDLNTDLSSLNTNLNKRINKNVGGYAGSDIKQKHFILMGDSYLRGTVCTDATTNPKTYSHNYEDGWGYKMCEMLQLDSSHVEAIVTGGASFALEGGTHWQDTIQSYVPTQNPDDIDCILLLGGANDRYSTRQSILNGIFTFVSRAKTLYPNATIMVGFIGYARHGSEISGIHGAVKAYHDGIINNNGVFLSGLENIMQDASLMGLDDLHPTTDGYTKIAECAANVVRGGAVDYIHSHNVTATAATSGDTITTLTYSICYLHNDIKKYHLQNLVLGLTSRSITLNPSSPIDLILLDDCDLLGTGSIPLTCVCRGFINHSGGTYTGTFIISLSDRTLRLTGIDRDDNGWLTLTGCTTISVKNVNFVSDGLAFS